MKAINSIISLVCWLILIIFCAVVDAGSSVTALNCCYVGNTVDKDITGTLIEY